MAVKLALVGRTPANNPDTILLKATFSGDYGVQGTGDLLNLAAASGENPGGITDPDALGVPLPDWAPDLPIEVRSESIGGYYVQPTLGTTLQNFALQVYAPGGAELDTDEAYPAAVLDGFVELAVRLPQIEA